MSNKASTVSRSIHINGIDKDMELSKVTVLKNVKPDMPEMIHFDRLKDGTWRLIYSESTIPDIQQVNSFDIIRRG